MALITVFGCVTEDLIPKQSQNKIAYVCFPLWEHLGKGRFQTFQVWVWGSDVSRIMRLGIKAGSLIWVSGSMELVDCTQQQGKERTKLLKVYCKDFGYLPRSKGSSQIAPQETGITETPPTPIVKELDGDRMPLPE